MKKSLVLSLLITTSLTTISVEAQTFVHPGILHTQTDFDRMRTKVNANAQPWKGSWDKLVASPHAQLSYTPRATATVIRGGTGDNVALLYNDVAAAYQHALIWKINGNTSHGNKARDILNAWSGTMTTLSGNADRFLAAGLFGYQLANVGEMMRGYSGFDLNRFKNLLLNVFYPMNNSFLVNHNDACITNYWANWDLCNMASILAIGILCDDRAKFDQAINYFKSGAGNGSINHAVWFMHSSTLGQWQESGRDQAHTILGVGLMGSFCEMAWNQGLDMYGWNNNRFMAGAEYVARYNLGNTVPYTTYNWGTGQSCAPMSQTVISAASRGENRPVWDMIYNHYANRRGLSVPNIAAYAERLRPEGGPGGHATTFDQPGFGSLTYTLDPLPPQAGPANGTYKIIARHSGKALEVADNGTANGSNVRQWPSNDCACQRWTVTNTGNNQYTIVGVGSGRNLDVANSSTADGANIQIWQSTGGNNQRFTFTATSSGYYRITPVHSGKAVDVAGNSTADGANIQQWTWNGGNNQQWQLVPVTAAARVTDAQNEPAFMVSPNPARDQVNIYLVQNKAAISMYNTKGQLVYAVSATGAQHIIDMKKLPAGLYYIKVDDGTKVSTQKIVKE
jgi:hypothetical protein